MAPRIAVKDASCLRFISDVLPLFPSPRVMLHLVLDTVGVVSATATQSAFLLLLVYIHHRTAVELDVAGCKVVFFPSSHIVSHTPSH